MEKSHKAFTIVAGPNGAEKTTFISHVFQDLIKDKKFINADLMAQEMSPDNISQASILADRRFIDELQPLINGNQSFVIETTLSGLSLLKRIKQAKSNDFQINLIFLWIDSCELCDFRIKGRVSMGGHNVPLDDIVRRYRRGLANFNLYLEFIDECKVYLANDLPLLIYDKSSIDKNKIINALLYEKFQSTIRNFSKANTH